MSTLTIRNVPSEAIKVLKQRALQKGYSMEQELRELISTRYTPRENTLKRVRERLKKLPKVRAKDLQGWKSVGRK